MTPAAAAQLYADRSDQIDLVMRVESARWGDNQIDSGRRIRYTRPDWVDVRNDLYENYFPERTEKVVAQFVRAELFTPGEAPQFSINGSPQHGGFANPGSQLTMAAAAGEIYFTVDGSDPRVEGGGIAGGAMLFGDAVPLDQSATISARLRKADGTWSRPELSPFFHQCDGDHREFENQRTALPSGGSVPS